MELGLQTCKVHEQWVPKPSSLYDLFKIVFLEVSFPFAKPPKMNFAPLKNRVCSPPPHGSLRCSRKSYHSNRKVIFQWSFCSNKPRCTNPFAAVRVASAHVVGLSAPHSGPIVLPASKLEQFQFIDWLQDGPLPVINGVITPINGLIIR